MVSNATTMKMASTPERGKHMSAPRYLPSDSTLRKWRIDEGLTLKQIAQRVKDTEGYDVTVGSVASALSRAGIVNRKRYDDVIPWRRIKTAHNKEYALVMLRLLARRRNGDELDRDLNGRLDNWLFKLEESNAVVLYKYNSQDGFYYVPRRPEDPKDIPVRMPPVSTETPRRAS